MTVFRYKVELTIEELLRAMKSHHRKKWRQNNE
jgi:hypothetical protein